MLADEQVEVGVERHPVALERRVPHLGHRAVERDLAANVGRHVGEVEDLLVGVPDRPLGERESGRELLDTRALFDEVVDRVRLRVDSGHFAVPFRDGGCRRDANTTPMRVRGTLRAMRSRPDTVVFIPAWNEEENLPACSHELAAVLPDADVLVIDDGSTDATADGRARRPARSSSRSGRTAACGPGSPPAIARPPSAATRSAAGSTPTASIRRPSSRGCSSSSAPTPATSRSARASRPARATTTTATCRRRAAASGSACCRRRCTSGSGRPFHDPTSGMAAVNAKAMPVMARPYVSGAPEVEALLRLKAEGLRVEEVAVHMRERASGESKLQGKKARQARADGRRDAALLPLAAPPPARERPDAAGDRRPRLLGRRPGRAPPDLRGTARAGGRASARPTTSSCSRLGARAGDAVRGGADGGRLERRGAGARGRPGRADDGRERGERRSNDIARVGAREVVVVTSRWHARARQGGVPTGCCVASARPRRGGASRPSRRNARARSLRELAAVGACCPRKLWHARRFRARPTGWSPGSGLSLSRSTVPTPPRRGSAASSRAAGRRRGRRGRRGSRPGSRAPSPPACRRRCRGRTGP